MGKSPAAGNKRLAFRAPCVHSQLRAGKGQCVAQLAIISANQVVNNYNGKLYMARRVLIVAVVDVMSRRAIGNEPHKAAAAWSEQSRKSAPLSSPPEYRAAFACSSANLLPSSSQVATNLGSRLPATRSRCLFPLEHFRKQAACILVCFCSAWLAPGGDWSAAVSSIASAFVSANPTVFACVFLSVRSLQNGPTSACRKAALADALSAFYSKKKRTHTWNLHTQAMVNGMLNAYTRSMQQQHQQQRKRSNIHRIFHSPKLISCFMDGQCPIKLLLPFS